jgi:hypothetical protein
MLPLASFFRLNLGLFRQPCGYSNLDQIAFAIAAPSDAAHWRATAKRDNISIPGVGRRRYPLCSGRQDGRRRPPIHSGRWGGGQMGDAREKSKRGRPAGFHGCRCKRAAAVHPSGRARSTMNCFPSSGTHHRATRTLSMRSRVAIRLANLSRAWGDDHSSRDRAPVPAPQTLILWMVRDATHRDVRFQALQCTSIYFKGARLPVTPIVAAQHNSLSCDCCSITPPSRVLLSTTLLYRDDRIFHRHGGLGSQRQYGGCPLLRGQVLSP